MVLSNTMSNKPASSHANSNIVESFPFFSPLYKELLHLYFLFPIVQIIFMIIISDQVSNFPLLLEMLFQIMHCLFCSKVREYLPCFLQSKKIFQSVIFVKS